MNVLRHTDIGIHKTCAGLRSLKRAIAEGPSRCGISSRAYVLISREGSVVHEGMATEGLHLRRIAVGTSPPAAYRVVKVIGRLVNGQRKAAMNLDNGRPLPAAY